MLALYPQYILLQFCPIQSTFINDADEIEVKWLSSRPATYTSSPLCLNEKQEIVKRVCTESGEWQSPNPPQCSAVQKQFQPTCPLFHISFGNLCIFISDPQPWTNHCPVPDVLNITEPQYLKILYRLGLQKLWLPVRRSEPFGKLMWTYPKQRNISYNHPSLRASIMKEPHIYDCVIISKIDDTTFSYVPRITNCSSKYPIACIYPLISTYSVQKSKFHCSRQNSNACFFTKYERSSRLTRQSICRRFAEPKSPEENYIIKEIVDEETCWIGLEKSREGKFKWSRSGDYINYTDWALTTRFNRTFGAISKAGWTLYDGARLPCAACQIDLPEYKVDLTLALTKNGDALVLTMYSPFSFINVFCRTSGLIDLEVNFKWTLAKTNKHAEDSNIIYSEVGKEQRKIWLVKPTAPGYYWCMGEIFPDAKILQTKKVLFGINQQGREYAFEILLENFCKFQFICDPQVSKFYKEIENKFYKKLRHDLVDEVRAVKILDVNNNGDLKLLLHIRAFDTRLSLVAEYHILKKMLYAFIKNNNDVSISLLSLKSCIGCLPSSTISGDTVTELNWAFTEVGTRTLPKELCLQSNMIPVTRACVGDFTHGAEWSEVEGVCANNIVYSKITEDLHSMAVNFSDTNITYVIEKLSNLTKNNSDLTAVDIYYLTQILVNISSSNVTYESNSTVVEDLSEIFSNLMATNVTSLKMSNRLLNATNTLLLIIDRLVEQLGYVDLNEEGIYRIVTPNIIYQVSDPFVNNITGIAVIKPNVTGNISFTEYSIKPLTANTSINELLLLNLLEVATFVPDELLDDIRNISTNNGNGTRICVSLFYNDSMFNENMDEKQIGIASRILSVTISGYENYLPSPVPIIFRPLVNISKDKNQECVYWSFGSNTDENIVYPSEWTTDAGAKIESANISNLKICEFTHLTHFALLIGTKTIPGDAIGRDFIEDNILDILTAVGCILSILGITGIVLTAIMFKSWREKIGTKVLLNVSACTILQMVVLYVADMNNFQKNHEICVFTGAVLHYSMLSGFCWMIVAAFLQYMRFVRVIGSPPPHLLLKASVVGWVLPSIPVLVLLAVDSHSYIPDAERQEPSLCYPQGIALYVTLLLPVTVIVFVNLIIFCLILLSISRKAPRKANVNPNMLGQQLKLAVLLFFLLGLTWIFGLIAASHRCTLCMYLFCLTATLPGFVLFVFYVLLDSGTRRLWTSLLAYKPINGKQASSNATMQHATEESSVDGENAYDEVKTYRCEAVTTMQCTQRAPDHD